MIYNNKSMEEKPVLGIGLLNWTHQISAVVVADILNFCAVAATT